MVQSLRTSRKSSRRGSADVTNGVTPRRWLALANQPLSEVLDENIGRTWRTDLSQLSELEQHIDFPTVNKPCAKPSC